MSVLPEDIRGESRQSYHVRNRESQSAPSALRPRVRVPSPEFYIDVTHGLISSSTMGTSIKPIFRGPLEIGEVLGHAVQCDFDCCGNFPMLLGGGKGEAGSWIADFFPGWQPDLSGPSARLPQ